MSAAEDTGFCVLLVEDFAHKIIAIRILLDRFADARFMVEEAHSLSAALGRLARGGIDIVLLDSRLPDSDGLEALATLRSRFPDTPVIMLTDFGDRQWAPMVLRMGAKDCIVEGSIDSRLLGQIILRHIKGA